MNDIDEEIRTILQIALEQGRVQEAKERLNRFLAEEVLITNKWVDNIYIRCLLLQNLLRDLEKG